MRKSVKNFIAMLIVCFGILQIPIMVFAKIDIPAATSDFYVNDFASVFSSDEKLRLIDNAVKLCDEHDGIQVVITTVESLNGNTVDDYALEMYNQYGIGENDMGLLILLSTGDRDIRIEVGRAMEAYITDSKAGRFIDSYAIPYLKENKFNDGLINLQEALIAEVISCVENDTTESVAFSNSNNSLGLFSALGSLLFIGVIGSTIAFIISAIRKAVNSNKEKQNAINNLTKQLDESKQNVAGIRNSSQKEINLLSTSNNKLRSDYQKLQDKYNILEDRYRRVQMLYPTADKDVSKMIEEETRKKDMALAEKVDRVIQNVLFLSPSKDALPKLTDAKFKYSELTSKQRSYLNSDINKLNQLYDESLRLKNEYDKQMEIENNKRLAATAVASITAIISCMSVGKARDLNKLRDAKSIYDNLSIGSRQYFDKSVLVTLDRLYDEAKRDKARKDEEERRRKREEEERRRRQHNSSHSSYGGGSHHSGLGGRSGHGGASRHF